MSEVYWMATSLVNTIEALKTFQLALSCARCRVSQKNLQHLGSSCKHAFCWDCVGQMESEFKGKRGILPNCPICAMPFNFKGITDAKILNNCYDMVSELSELITSFGSTSMSNTDIACTQRIFENFERNENLRTVDEFLLTQPADLDISSAEKEIRHTSNSPELDVFTNYEELNKTPKDDEKVKKRAKGSKRKAPLFNEEETWTSKGPSAKRPVREDLFCSQVPTKAFNDSSLTPFVSRRKTAPAENISGLVAKHADTIKTIKTEVPTDDLFSKKVLQPRRSSTINIEVKQEEIEKIETPTTRSTRKSITSKLSESKNDRKSLIKAEEENSKPRKSSSRSSSPASFEKLAKEPRRSSFGTRRGEAVIINSILRNRIPQLQSAIDAGTCINEKDNNKTPLFVAVENNNLEAVKVLIEAGAIINASCLNSCDTTLHEAVRRKNVKIADYLLSKGASMKIMNSWQKTPEQLIQNEDKEMRKVFEQYRNRPCLQPTILPRKPIIHFVHLIDDNMLTEKEKLALPGKINLVNADMDGITHVVVNVDPQTKILNIGKDSTGDVLKAITKRGSVVSLEWLKACIANKSKGEITEKKYLVKKVRWMDGNIIEESLEKWKKAIDKMSPKLFAGCKFYFPRAKYSFLDRVSLVEIVRAGGGQVFPREPLVDIDDPPPYHNPELKPNLIIYSLSHDLPSKFQDKSKYSLVCEQWLIESILSFSIRNPY